MNRNTNNNKEIINTTRFVNIRELTPEEIQEVFNQYGSWNKSAPVCRCFIPALIECLQSNGFLNESEGDISIPGSCILVGYRGRVFQIDSNFQVFESTTEYNAIGSGAQIALGSLYALMTPHSQNYHSDKLYYYIDMSLNAASMFSASVNRPFRILKLTKD